MDEQNWNFVSSEMTKKRIFGLKRKVEIVNTG
jgi:hypothetical protein